jgi:hypothetical protein
MVMPAEMSALALSSSPRTGRYTLLGFFDLFIRPSYTGTPAQRAYIRPLANWWRLSCTNTVVGGPTETSIALVGTATPLLQAKVASHSNHVMGGQMSRVGVGGPGLTGTAFALGITELRNTLEGNHAATLAYEQAKSQRTFTDMHGDALAATLHRLCGVVDDQHLPPIHNLLTKTAKGRQYGVIAAAFAERAAASTVGLQSMHAPLATVALVDNVFRNFNIGGEGLEFGKGLTPFAVVCPGHIGSEGAVNNTRRAAMLESGNSTNLADIDTLTTVDVRFPAEAYVAAEKLYAWSIVVDVFHGVNHPVAAAVRDAVTKLAPQLQRTATSKADNAGAGMEIVCRVLYDVQQEYFAWVNGVISGTAGVALPDFSIVIKAVNTYRAESLSPMPATWYNMVSSPTSTPLGPSAPMSAPAPMRAVGAAPVVNAHSDAGLKQRFKDGGYDTITSMVGGRSIEFPKHSGKPVCMVWALKGACTANCKRAAQHVRYSAATNKGIHEFMNACGVANPPN